MGIVGVLFGYVLTRIGFGSWTEVHRMFNLRDPRMLLTFVGAMALLMPVYYLLRSRLNRRLLKTSWRTVFGAVFFGLGWAVSGACPSTVLTQIGAGNVPALMTLLGVGSGILLHQQFQRRWLLDESADCDS